MCQGKVIQNSPLCLYSVPPTTGTRPVTVLQVSGLLVWEVGIRGDEGRYLKHGLLLPFRAWWIVSDFVRDEMRLASGRVSSEGSVDSMKQTFWFDCLVRVLVRA